MPAHPGWPACLPSEPCPKRPSRTPNSVAPVKPGSDNSFGSSYFGTLSNRRLGLRGLFPASPMPPSCPKNDRNSRGRHTAAGGEIGDKATLGGSLGGGVRYPLNRYPSQVYLLVDPGTRPGRLVGEDKFRELAYSSGAVVLREIKRHWFSGQQTRCRRNGGGHA
jgi:hypothetical protein